MSYSPMLRRLAVAGLVLAAIPWLAAPSSARGALRVAACKRDITPVSPNLAAAYEETFGEAAAVNHADPILLAGFSNGREATGYNDRLWARGVVVEAQGQRIAIVSLDLIGYFTNEIETIRGLISPKAKIDYLVVSSTHQHEGPDTMGLWGPNELSTGIDFGYLDFVNASVADCVEKATQGLQQARVRFTTTDSAGLSLGLDAEDDGLGVADGKVLAGDEALAPATDGRFVDSRLSVMQFIRRNKRRVLATLVNFASHPESLGSDNTLVTSDFPHYARERLEAEYAGVAIWVSADLGVLQGPLDIDVLDPETSEPAPRRTFRFAEVHGTQLAERVIAAVDPKGRGDKRPDLSYATTNPLPIPVANPFFRALAAVGAINSRRDFFTDGEPENGFDHPFPPPFQALPQATGEDLHTEVGALRLGEGSFAVVPTELDPQIGEGYRAAMTGANHTFIIGLGNDAIGYQVPFAKWDDSCHACAMYVFAGVEDLCPVQPIDCNTVFQNNVGQEVDPKVSGAIMPLIESLHD